MGCDIHAHIEIKINGKWEHYNAPRGERDYDLFARIANVRNDGTITPIDNPRGLPEDATLITKFEADWEDGHSHTWLNAQELGDLEKWADEKYRKDYDKFHDFQHHNYGYLFRNSFYGFANQGPGDTSYPPELEDVRFICWFDS